MLIVRPWERASFRWLLAASLAVVILVAADFDLEAYERDSGADAYEHYGSVYGGPIFRFFRAVLIRLWDSIEAHHDALLVVFTVVLAISTIGLWFVTRGLAIDASNTSQKQVSLAIATERAYVFVDAVMLEHYGAVSDSLGDPVRRRHLEVRMRLRNHGKTPAILVKVVAGVKITSGSPDRNGLTDVPSAAGKIISFTDAEPLETDIYPVVEAEYDAAQKGRVLRVYYVGRVDYLDVLKIPRWTEFQWPLDFSALRFEPWADLHGRDWE